MRHAPRLLLKASLTFGLILSTALVSAQKQPSSTPNHHSSDTILLGQSLPLSGPSAQLGQEYRAGAQAWFNEVNRLGGIKGSRIELVSLDDQYEPQKTILNTRSLLARPNLLALFGYVGTPTTKTVLPLIEQARVPLIAPLTGASLLRDPKLRMVFNLRASYQQELDKIVHSLVRDARRRIAVVYQDDAFGRDGLQATQAALQRHGLKATAIATVQRNSAKINSALTTLETAQPNAVIIISAYVSSAALSEALIERDLNAQIMNVSFVGTRALEESMPAGQASGIGISQVVPFPWDRWIPVVADYQRLMRAGDSAAGLSFTSLEGFMAARLMTEALQRSGTQPTRQTLLKALQSIQKVDLGGFVLDLSAEDHQASDYVELTFFGAQQWEP